MSKLTFELLVSTDVFSVESDSFDTFVAEVTIPASNALFQEVPANTPDQVSLI